MVMKQISVQALKAGLSAAIADAEAGNTVVITRHNSPVARLTGVGPTHTHRGKHVGKGWLRPALKRGTGGRTLAVLAEDRTER